MRNTRLVRKYEWESFSLFCFLCNFFRFALYCDMRCSNDRSWSASSSKLTNEKRSRKVRPHHKLQRENTDNRNYISELERYTLNAIFGQRRKLFSRKHVGYQNVTETLGIDNVISASACRHELHLDVDLVIIQVNAAGEYD